MTRFAVVGGGIAGLAAAWELRRLDPDAAVTVYEPGQLGGKLRTSPFAGRLLDEGADAFLARVPESRELCEQLGLAASLVSPATGVAFVARDRRLHRLPAGLVLGVPTDASALAGCPLVSPDAVARVLAEPGLGGAPLAPGDPDVSIGALIRHRFGDDVLEHLVDPLLGGINAGDSDRLSLRAAAPQLAAAASASGSLVEGLRALAADRSAVSALDRGGPVGVGPEAGDASPASGLAAGGPATPPVFWALPGGMAALVDALVAALRDAGVRFVADAVDDLGALDVDGVVLATPAPATARLAQRIGAATAADALAGIRHASPVLLALAFHRRDVRHRLDGSGFLVPKPEGRIVTACSFATTKWAHLGAVDDDLVVLRVSAGRDGDDRAIGLDDDVLLGAVLHDLDELLGLGGDPAEVRVSRWRNGFPQYEPGHLDRVAAIEADLATVGAGGRPRIAVAGATYRGVGIPACIRSARAAARTITGAA